MNWKQLAKAVVDEVQKWANDRFADLEKVRTLIAAEVRELKDAQGTLAKDHGRLAAEFARHAAAPAPTATVDGAQITHAVDAWFTKNPPPIPKDGTSVDVEDLQPFLQAGLAKWQLEFERNASAVLQRFLEKLRQPADGKPGEPGAAGKDATPEAIRAAVDAFMVEHPLPQLDADAMARAALEQCQAAVDEFCRKGDAIAAAVAAYMKEHPAPARGPTVAELEPLVAAWLEAHPPARGKDGAPGKDGERGADGAAGKDGAPGERGEQGPAGSDGAPGARGEPGPAGTDGRDGAAGEKGERGEQGEPGPAGPAGERGDVGTAGRDGAAGKDGAPGADGKSVTLEEVRPLFDAAFASWALDFEKRATALFEKAVDRIAPPKDGRDGLAVENLGLELEADGRTLRFVLADGERRHVATVKLAIPLDRGVFKDNAPYERGDVVTFGGSMWIAQKDAPKGRPGTSVDWRLAVKHGRDAAKK